jgi:hypothetical protein
MIEYEEKKFKLGNTEIIALVIIGILFAVIAYNMIRMTNIVSASQSGTSVEGNSILQTVSASEILPTGVPETYGKELNIKYDDVSVTTPQKADATIGVMSNLDRTITLEGADLQRYIAITSRISCEYCCGAKSIIFSDGKPACGCAHSYAMRGLAKYLITNHGDEYTDDEILGELGKWKVLFFPGIHETKAEVLKSQGIEINYINLASNEYRGIEKGASSSGGMVGGC